MSAATDGSSARAPANRDLIVCRAAHLLGELARHDPVDDAGLANASCQRRSAREGLCVNSDLAGVTACVAEPSPTKATRIPWLWDMWPDRTRFERIKWCLKGYTSSSMLAAASRSVAFPQVQLAGESLNCATQVIASPGNAPDFAFPASVAGRAPHAPGQPTLARPAAALPALQAAAPFLQVCCARRPLDDHR